MPPPGIEPATYCFLACHSNHSAIGRDIDMLLELLQYFLSNDTTRIMYRVQGLKENKNERTLLTYSFVIDTI